jgi:L-malate glycosyltransferase
MTKICLIGNSDSTHIQRWSDWFVNRGYEVHLITTGTKKIQKVTMHLLKKNKNPLNYFLRILRTIRIIRKLKPDIINGHYLSSTETFAAALSHYHPFIVSAWGSDIAIDPDKSWVFKTEVKYVLRQADLVHTGDQFGKNRLIQLGCNEEKIFIIPWGVDFELFRTNTKCLEKSSKYVVLCACPWVPNRNPKVLLHAIPYVIKELKEITFIFLGGGSLEDELKATAKDLGIEDVVLFVGRIPHEEIPIYLSTADLLVDTDIVGNNSGAGIGVTNLEAMICGVPILLSEREYLRNIGGSLLNESWYCSLIYEPGDSIDLSKKILQLLRDESLRKEIAEREMKIARAIGDWNKNMEKMEQIMFNRR